MEKDFRYICDRLGIQAELPVKNKTAARKPYQDYFDEETRKIVEERFSIDIDVFGYSF